MQQYLYIVHCTANWIKIIVASFLLNHFSPTPTSTSTSNFIIVDHYLHFWLHISFFSGTSFKLQKIWEFKPSIVCKTFFFFLVVFVVVTTLWFTICQYRRYHVVTNLITPPPPKKKQPTPSFLTKESSSNCT